MLPSPWFIHSTVQALDARTGAVAWNHQVADPKAGYRYTSGPIIARGAIVAGITGCQRYKNDVCFISPHARSMEPRLP